MNEHVKSSKNPNFNQGKFMNRSVKGKLNYRTHKDIKITNGF